MSSDKEVIKDLYDKVDHINATLSDMKVTQAKQQVILEEHIRRTTINEQATAINAQAIVDVHKELIEQISPLKTEMAKLSGMIKLLGGMVAVGSLIIQLAQLFMSK
ncbi:MAG: hypothetical protein QXL01_01555 [Thermoplasmatales archaeon]